MKRHDRPFSYLAKRDQNSPEEIFKTLAGLTTASRVAIRDAYEDREKYIPRYGFYPVSWLEPSNREIPVLSRKCLNAAGLIARDLLISRWDEIEEASRDPILDKLAEMAPFVDAGWDGRSGWAPSEILQLRYLIAVTDLDDWKRIIRMKLQAAEWIEEGRRRWRAGFSADPTGEPKPRLRP